MNRPDIDTVNKSTLPQTKDPFQMIPNKSILVAELIALALDEKNGDIFE